MNKLVPIVVIVVFLGIAAVVGINLSSTGEVTQASASICPSSCDDGNACTKDYCSEATDYQCRHELIEPCCGDGICGYTENLNNCQKDCAPLKTFESSHFELESAKYMAIDDEYLYIIDDYGRIHAYRKGDFSLAKTLDIENLDTDGIPSSVKAITRPSILVDGKYIYGCGGSLSYIYIWGKDDGKSITKMFNESVGNDSITYRAGRLMLNKTAGAIGGCTIAIDSDYIYQLVSFTNLRKWDKDGNLLDTVKLSRPEQIEGMGVRGIEKITLDENYVYIGRTPEGLDVRHRLNLSLAYYKGLTSWFHDMAIDSKYIYFATSDSLFVIEKSTGKTIKTFSYEHPYQACFSLAVDAENLYCGAYNTLIVHDKNSFELMEEFSLLGGIPRVILTDEDYIYAQIDNFYSEREFGIIQIWEK